MKGAGDNFIQAALESLEQDTDVDWRPRVPQWPAIGETMATAHPVGAGRPEEAEGSARRGAGPHPADPEGLTAQRIAGERAARADARARRSAASRSRCSRRRCWCCCSTTTAPLVYLAWNSLHRLDLGMPWLSGFAGLDNYAKMGSDPRFWNSLWLTAGLHRLARSCCRW